MSFTQTHKTTTKKKHFLNCCMTQTMTTIKKKLLYNNNSTLLFNSLANDNSLRYLFYQQISNSAFKPDNPNQCKRLSLQYELHNRIRKTSRQSLHSCDTHKPDKRLSLPTKLSQNLVQDAAHHTEKSVRKSSAFSTSSYIDNPYSVPMQCSPYLFRKLSMSQLKVRLCELCVESVCSVWFTKN
jgi:hypothetical protein